ncbi:MAG: hypothetical protein JMJ93_02140 [Synergistaceae bacterium]|nr:hypothetical protein [Synergistaceae bacterium]
MKRALDDLLSFGRIIGAALVVVGFVLLAVFLGNKARQAGYPSAVVFLIYLLGAFFALWQGWLSLRVFWKQGR